MSGHRFDKRVYQALHRPNLALRKSLRKLISLCVHIETNCTDEEVKASMKFKLDELESTLPKEVDDNVGNK